ncbi:DUF5994 family protein [Saccharomonospora azurea]|uniref:DUF5994 family protein n=1 Tax=Saccharomonospora azurea TaxID=40988 RepID=UPI00024005F9|nr:DUF5994 family protein [Saccharomonospora azurea]EHK86933.1 hypothetical protein SZMC14600_13077 [Saccharomonospora azurea SZMC 14600]
MISAQQFTPDLAGRHAVRLEMKRPDAARGHVDGGWWPRSAEPEAEFSELCAALEPWIGVASRVSYHLGTWGVASRRIEVNHRVVRLEGFLTMDPHTVVVIGSDSRRVTLLMVPADTAAEVSRAQLRAAAATDPTANVEELRQGSHHG